MINIKVSQKEDNMEYIKNYLAEVMAEEMSVLHEADMTPEQLKAAAEKIIDKFDPDKLKNFVLATVIFFLVLSTAIIKNTTKQIEDEIFAVKENIRVLNSEFGNISLEYDYLSSSERLLEFQSQYFEDELIQKNINDIKVYNTSNDVNKIKNFKIIKE